MLGRGAVMSYLRILNLLGRALMVFGNLTSSGTKQT
jgi:hypothetical protein